jgi:hypothetical protein
MMDSPLIPTARKDVDQSKRHQSIDCVPILTTTVLVRTCGGRITKGREVDIRITDHQVETEVGHTIVDGALAAGEALIIFNI